MILRCLAAAAAVLLLAVQPALAQQSTILRNPTNTAPFGTEANPIVVGGGVLGATGESACATDNGACSIAALIKRNNQRVTSLITALGSPLQAGASVGISGTLPAFASTPTFNLGGLNGAATAANQASQQAVLEAMRDDTTPVDVNLRVGGGAASAGAGAAGSTTQRVIPASDATIGLDARTTGGCTPGVYRSTASNNSTSIKASAGTLCKLVAINTTATPYYLRFYNTGSAPNCASGTGEVASYPVPADTTGAGVAVPVGPFGEAYTSGIGFCIVGGSAANDNTNAAAGVTVSYSFK